MKNQYFGSDFDDFFLAEEGLLAEAEATAIKRVIAYQIQQALQKSGISKTEMAQKMQTTTSSVTKNLFAYSSALSVSWREIILIFNQQHQLFF